MGVWLRAASPHLGWAVTCLCQNILTPPLSTYQHRGLQRERDGREPQRHFYCRSATDNHKFSDLLFNEQCRINYESCILRYILAYWWWRLIESVWGSGFLWFMLLKCVTQQSIQRSSHLSVLFHILLFFSFSSSLHTLEDRKGPLAS